MTHVAEMTGTQIGALNGRVRRALVVGGALLLLVASYFMVIHPVVVIPLVQQRSMLVSEREGLARDRALLGTRPAQRDSLRLHESARLFSGSPVDAMAELTTNVGALARSSQVALTMVKPLESSTERGVASLPVEVHGNGSWAASLAFVHALASTTRLLKVRALRIDRGTSLTRTDDDLVTFSAIIVGYCRSGP